MIQQCRDGRVVNARALRARGSRGPQGFKSLSRRHIVKLFFVAGWQNEVVCSVSWSIWFILMRTFKSATRVCNSNNWKLLFFNYTLKLLEVKNKQCLKEPCTKSNVLVAANQPRCPSNLHQTSQFTVEHALLKIQHARPHNRTETKSLI